MNTLKIYDIVVPLTDELTGVGAISLVEHPAVEIGFLKFNDDKPIQLQFNDDKHIITGVAMLADTPIYRNNEHYGEHYVVFSKQTIRNIVEKYAKFGYQNIVNIEHSADRFVNDVYMIESYLIDKERGIIPNEFKDVPDGSWIVSYKINNLAVWDEIKAGNVLGFSIEGLFSYGNEVVVDEHSKDKEETFDEWLDRMVNEIENK
jgi:hypothetical protein